MKNPVPVGLRHGVEELCAAGAGPGTRMLRHQVDLQHPLEQELCPAEGAGGKRLRPRPPVRLYQMLFQRLSVPELPVAFRTRDQRLVVGNNIVAT